MHGRDQHPRLRLPGPGAIQDHVAPTGRKGCIQPDTGPDADAKIAQHRFGDDRARYDERARDDDRSERIAEDMPKDDLSVACTDRTRCFDELLLLEREHLPANQSRDAGPVHDRERDEQQHQPIQQLAEGCFLEGDLHDDEEEQRWETHRSRR